MDVPDFVREAEEAMARGETLGGSYTEVTIKFGKGVWMKLPEDGTTRLSRSVKNGIDDAGLGIWGAINLLEGYGNDNPGANAHVR